MVAAVLLASVWKGTIAGRNSWYEHYFQFIQYYDILFYIVKAHSQ